MNEERAGGEDKDVLGARWNEDPMEWNLPDEVEEEEAPSDYGEDPDSEAESQQEMVDSDDEFHDELEDIRSDDEFLPVNQNPPRSPSNGSNRSNVTIDLAEETDEHGHTVYIQEYDVPTARQPVRLATEQELSRGEYPDVGKLSNQHCFELAQLLMASGMSANYQNKLFCLQRANQEMDVTSDDRPNKGRYPHGDWMWEMQGEIEDKFGTIIPVIISSDETKLTSFSGDKKAHPVYITIGNLPKRLRRRTSKRANILLGYLPVPKLNCESNKEERTLQHRHLFHQCMRLLVKPLAEAAKTRVEVPCADGGVRRIYPLLASYIANFPEQCKVACIKQTHCPLCTAHPKQKGDLTDWPPRTHAGVTEAMDAD
ncbi:hypothetical protein FRC07_007899 [Ceratobasidium sp. 392]|nr:hypothetical protein FRC07_007899 [Ceratobasidium sp. 392]